MSARDERFERTLLELATRNAHLVGIATPYFDAVQERLEKGEREYDGEWVHGGLERLLRELAEEGADAGGWGSLAAQLTFRLQVEEGISADDAAEIQADVLSAIAGGVIAWHHAQKALDRCREAAASSRARSGRTPTSAS